eukprot:18522-Pelagococcus_subviridis.AAC.8
MTLRRDAVLVAAPVILARVAQRRRLRAAFGGHRALREPHRVQFDRVLRELLEPDALDAAHRALEALRDNLGVQTERFEDLRALVRRERGDAHLGENLEHAVFHGVEVVGDELLHRRGLLLPGRVRDEVVLAQTRDGVHGEVRADAVRAERRERAKVVHVPRLGGFEKNRDARALHLSHEVMMHRADGEERGHRDARGARGAVGQDDARDAVRDRGGRLLREEVEGLLQAGFAFGEVVRRVEDSRRPPRLRGPHRLQGFHLLGREERRLETQPVRVLRGRRDEVALGADHALERRHDGFANRVDRRVGDLREHLLEVFKRQLRDLGHDRERGVVPHRTERLGPGRDHREEDHVQGFAREPRGSERSERADEAVVRELGAVDFRLREISGGGHDVLELDDLVLHPLRVRVLRRDLRFHVRVLKDRPLVEVDEEDVPRTKAALLRHVRRVDVHDAHLGRHDDPRRVALGDVEPAGAKTVAVERRSDLVPVRERHERGAVPGFHLRGHVLVKRSSRRVHVRVVLPRLRDHHHDRLREGATAAADEELEHRVERARVGQAAFDHPELLRDVDESLAREHPVLVPLERVNLAVVAHHVKRLRAVPRRERVRGEPRVHQRQIGGESLVLKVGIVRHHLVRLELPLVHDSSRRERAAVEVVEVLRELHVAALLHADARESSEDVERGFDVDLFPRGGTRVGLHEELRDVRLRGHRAVAQVRAGGVHRDVSPADDVEPQVCARLLHAGDARGFRVGIVLREIEHPEAVLPGRGEIEVRDVVQEAVRDRG